MGRKAYSDDERAAVYLGLVTTGDAGYESGNVAQASKITGVPEQTVRDWRDSWQANGVPPEVQAIASQEAESFAEHAETVRDKMLYALEEDIPNMKGKELAIAIGILTDKAMRARGLNTSKVIHEHHALPAPEQVAALVDGFMGAIRSKQDERDLAITEVAKEQPKGLPMTTGR